ncbi:MAG TPA: flagellar hook-basal body complex protein FliE [Chthoniobacterales bacterium]|jgi:flagellar hook-basal body complex protein FliE
MIGNIGNYTASLASRILSRPENPAALTPDDVNPAALLGLNGAPVKLGRTQATDATQTSSFSNFIDNAVQEVDGKMKAAASDQAEVLTGETNNLHQAMISMQEASVAFSLMVEVRNKLVDSYQELMRMQV